MENKKLTGREALAYMATGRWFTSLGNPAAYSLKEDGEVFIYRVDDYQGTTKGVISFVINGITPCPEPTVKVDEYEEDKKAIYNGGGLINIADVWAVIEKHFQRKEGK